MERPSSHPILTFLVCQVNSICGYRESRSSLASKDWNCCVRKSILNFAVDGDDGLHQIVWHGLIGYILVVEVLGFKSVARFISMVAMPFVLQLSFVNFICPAFSHSLCTSICSQVSFCGVEN